VSIDPAPWATWFDAPSRGLPLKAQPEAVGVVEVHLLHAVGSYSRRNVDRYASRD
jgi:hypothetical protein